MLTAEFADDLGNCLNRGKPTEPFLFFTTNQCIPPKMYSAEAQSCFVCVCKVMTLVCVEFCVVSTVHKFDFRLRIKVGDKRTT